MFVKNIREITLSLTVQSDSFFFQIISNHFELENVVKMTPKRRSFLPALFFTCFCITRPLLKVIP